MRNNYVGDVGDFYKYGLLRHLTGYRKTDNNSALKFKLGVVWYLYIDPCKVTDGQHLEYLSDLLQSRFRHYDSELYDKLRLLVIENKRAIEEVQKQGILPADTAYVSEPLSFLGMPKGTVAAITQRLSHRRSWLERALIETAKSEIVFFDPDNGLEIKSVPAHRDKGSKFCFYDELAEFWTRKQKQSLIIYQHKNMHETKEAQIKNRTTELWKQFPNAAWIENLYFSAGSGRIFFIVAQAVHAKLLKSRYINFGKLWIN